MQQNVRHFIRRDWFTCLVQGYHQHDGAVLLGLRAIKDSDDFLLPRVERIRMARPRAGAGTTACTAR